MECALECYQHKCMERATATVGVENYTPPTHFTDGSITLTAYCRYEDREYTETKTFRVTDSEHTAQVISGYDESCCSDSKGENEISPYALTLTMRGDLDGDKKLTINDATLLQKALAKIRGSLDLKNIDADMNRDGYTDIRDVTFMQRVISGYEQDK